MRSKDALSALLSIFKDPGKLSDICNRTGNFIRDPAFVEKLTNINRELLLCLSVLYILLSFIESLRPGFVSSHLVLADLLGFVILSGALYIVSLEPVHKRTSALLLEFVNKHGQDLIRCNHYLFIILVALYTILNYTGSYGTLPGFIQEGLLFFSVVSGIMLVFRPFKYKQENIKPGPLIVLLSAGITLILVWYSTRNLGLLSYLLSLIAGMLIFFILQLFFDQEYIGYGQFNDYLSFLKNSAGRFLSFQKGPFFVRDIIAPVFFSFMLSAFLLFEYLSIWPGSGDLVLLIIAISGIYIVLREDPIRSANLVNPVPIHISAVCAVVVGFLVLYATFSLGLLSFLLSVVCALLIFFTLLFFPEDGSRDIVVSYASIDEADSVNRREM